MPDRPSNGFPRERRSTLLGRAQQLPAPRRERAAPRIGSDRFSRHFGAIVRGTEVGFLFHVVSNINPSTSRRPDRRRHVWDLLAAVTRFIDQSDNVGLMREELEERLRRAVGLARVELRSATSPSTRRDPIPDGSNKLVFKVPVLSVSGATAAGSLEATFNPGRRPDEWGVQTIGLAAHIGALVLEIERCRTALALAGLLHGRRTRRDGAAPLIGSTPAMRTLRSTIERVAPIDFTVLIEGESGVGKELVARQIHDLSRRRNGPFVAINCAALVETLVEAELFGIEERTATGVRGRRGKFEAADGGTLFLDEVSDLSLSAQAKLLRAIQDLAVERVGGNGARPVDLRIVAATNRRLADLVERGLFRPDLFYRLSGVDVRVPSLRERRADIVELAQYFLSRHRSTRHLQLSSEAADALVAYTWPGNVRELQRLIERTVALAESDSIGLHDLPPPVGGGHLAALGPSLERDETMRTWARRYARIMLARRAGNKRQTALALGISYHTLQAYLREPLEEAHQSPESGAALALDASLTAGASLASDAPLEAVSSQ